MRSLADRGRPRQEPEARDPDPVGRSGFLGMRSALYDRVTGLSSYHLHLDALQLRLDGRRLGLSVLEFPSLARLELAWGWEVSDRLLSGVTALLCALKGRALPARTVIALDGVYGSSFLLLLPEGDDGREVEAADLEAMNATLTRHLLGRLTAADWAPPPPPPDFTLGYALVRGNPSARFERLVHQAIREARGMTLRAADRLEEDRTAEFRRILQEARVTTHYQPIVDMEQGAIMGYEALSRGPANTLLEVPKALFSCSDRAHLSSELDALCRRQALRNARGFDRSMKLFVNSLPETLGAPGFMDHGLRRVLEEMALLPRNLVLEITEGTAIEDFEAFGREIGLLRRQGFLVAIDDVGRGYSSLQSLAELQPDFLKIDISLIKNIQHSLIKQDLVRSLLRAGSRIGAQVIAEGIETEDEWRTVRSCGVRYGQGFYFARPAPAFPLLRRSLSGTA
jgi:EAL domain-containing protein (putative c-di-GMP-specific phosphodiesterase class I)